MIFLFTWALSFWTTVLKAIRSDISPPWHQEVFTQNIFFHSVGLDFHCFSKQCKHTLDGRVWILHLRLLQYFKHENILKTQCLSSTFELTHLKTLSFFPFLLSMSHVFQSKNAFCANGLLCATLYLFLRFCLTQIIPYACFSFIIHTVLQLQFNLICNHLKKYYLIKAVMLIKHLLFFKTWVIY